VEVKEIKQAVLIKDLASMHWKSESARMSVKMGFKSLHTQYFSKNYFVLKA